MSDQTPVKNRWIVYATLAASALVLSQRGTLTGRALGGSGCGGEPDPAGVGASGHGLNPVIGWADLHAHFFSTFVNADGYADRYRGARVYCPDRTGPHPECALLPSDFPDLKNHPIAGTAVDQKAYYEWIKRAKDLGQRLVVVLAVYNHTACEELRSFAGALLPGLAAGAAGVTPVTGCGVNTAIREQIEAVRRFVDWVADNDGGWLEIAYTPADARRIIDQNKLAVVLGVEVDDLFRCGKVPCTPAYVTEELEKLWSLGVRQITPIHSVDNGFGGAAIFTEAYSFTNFKYNQRYFDVEWCPRGDSAFVLAGRSGLYAIDAGLGTLGLGAGYDPPLPEWSGRPPAGHCNRTGLTPLGEHLLKEMMRLGILIDVDHMSERSYTRAHEVVTEPSILRTLGRAEPYPLVSSHTTLRTIKPDFGPPFDSYLSTWDIWKEASSEWNKTPDHILEIAATGGMFAPILFQYAVRDYGGGAAAPPNDCHASSTSFAHAYLAMQEIVGLGTGMGIGTDVNGRAPFPAPRFGPDACQGKERAPAGGGLDYTMAVLRNRRVTASQTGNRTFDIGTDGVAHYGMVPDMIAELEGLGLDSRAIDALFNSAEQYLRTWELAAPPASFEIAPIRKTYRGISDRAPEQFVAHGSCPDGPAIAHPARWWEFEIAISQLRGLRLDPRAALTAWSAPGGCVIEPGAPDKPIRMAAPIAPGLNPAMNGEGLRARVTVQDSWPSPGKSTAASASRWMELSPARPTLVVEVTGDPREEGGDCPVPRVVPEADPLELSAFRARFRQNGRRMMLPVRAVSSAHVPDFSPTRYSWRAELSGATGGPAPDWEVPVCHCGEELVTVEVEEGALLERASVTQTVRAPALDLVVHQELFDASGQPLPPNGTTPAALVHLVAKTRDGRAPFAPCEWVESFWRDLDDPDLTHEAPLDPSRLISPPGACEAWLELWRQGADPGSAPWRKSARGIVRVEEGPACGLRMWSVGAPELPQIER